MKPFDIPKGASEALLPCPFDGYAAGIETNGMGYWIECKSCCIKTHNWENREHAIKEWNRRPLEAKPAERSGAEPSFPTDRISGGLDLNGAKAFVVEKGWVPMAYFYSMLAEINRLRASLSSPSPAPAGLTHDQANSLIDAYWEAAEAASPEKGGAA